jgi:hypothetical protein
MMTPRERRRDDHQKLHWHGRQSSQTGCFQVGRRVELDGTANDVIDLSKVCGHPYLFEEFRMTNVTLTDSTLTLDQVVHGAGLCPQLGALVKLENACYCVRLGDGYCSSPTPLCAHSGLTDTDAIVFKPRQSLESASIQLIDINGNDLTDLGCKALDGFGKEHPFRPHSSRG